MMFSDMLELYGGVHIPIPGLVVVGKEAYEVAIPELEDELYFQVELEFEDDLDS